MNAYLELIRYLLVLFLIMTIFSIPAMSIYSSYGAIRTEPMGILSQFSRGNMGDASVMCKNVPLGITNDKGGRTDVLHFGCPTGVFSFDVKEYGIIPTDIDDTTHCLTSSMEKADEHKCTSYLRWSSMQSRL